MKRVLLLAILSLFAISSYAQDGIIHIVMLEPVFSNEAVFETDSCRFEFSYSSPTYNDNSGLVGVRVFNKTPKRAYIEWENARYDNSRIAFGDDSRITMQNPKADESIPSNSSSISREIMATSWVGSDFILNPIRSHLVRKKGGTEMEIIIPVRFGDTETIDYKFKLSVYYYNPVDCSQISEGMKTSEVKKILGKPDFMDLGTWGNPSNSDWYYASSGIITMKKGVVTNIQLINKPYISK